MSLDSSRKCQPLVCCLNLSPGIGLSRCPSPSWCPASVWPFPLMEEALGTTHTWVVTAMENIHLLGAIKLPGNSVPWLLFCLLEQCKSGPIRFFLQVISENNCPGFLLYLLFPVSISFVLFTFCIWQYLQNTYNPGASSGYTIICQLGTDWSHSFMFVYSTDICVGFFYAESWAHVWGMQDQIQFLALWCRLI